MKFELIEQFREESQEIMRGLEEMTQKRSSALEEHHALKAEYERTIRDSLRSGKDATAELDLISERVQKAEEAFKRRDLEYQIFSSNQTKKTTRDDVVDTWNNEFYPAYKREILDPVTDSLLAAKLAYIDAFLKYKEVVREYSGIKSDVLGTLAPSGDDGKYRYKMKDIEFQFKSETDTHFIKDQDVYELSVSQTPRSIQHVKRGKEDAK